MLKLGILISDLNKLMTWELRIIKTIIDDPELEISILIESKPIIPNFAHKLINFFKKPGENLLALQLKIEKKHVNFNTLLDKKDIINYLRQLPKIKEYNSENSQEAIREHKLDLILNFKLNEFPKPILNTAKYGIWSFNIFNNTFYKGGLIGFWEIVLKSPSVYIYLEQLSSDTTKTAIIDDAYLNKTRAFITTNNSAIEASIPLLFKNINKLKKGTLEIKQTAKHQISNKKLHVFHVIKYLIIFYSFILNKFVKKINYKLFKTKYDCWTLAIGQGDFMNASLKDLKPITLPKDEFWADPFFYKHNNQLYVFFESFPYSTRRGKICCGRIENNEIVEVNDILNFDYHLSYPNIFEEDGDIFMMPETYQDKKLIIYRCLDFPYKWESYATAFEGEKVFDATFYNDDENQKWLFVNKMRDNSPYDSELHIYKVDSLKMNHLEPHQQNPVIISSKTSRNAGPFFKYQGDTYRPSQYNVDGIYGRGLNINKVKKLTLEEYSEEHIKTVMPDFIKGTHGTHHLHQFEDQFVIDVCYKKK